MPDINNAPGSHSTFSSHACYHSQTRNTTYLGYVARVSQLTVNPNRFSAPPFVLTAFWRALPVSDQGIYYPWHDKYSRVDPVDFSKAANVHNYEKHDQAKLEYYLLQARKRDVSVCTSRRSIQILHTTNFSFNKSDAVNDGHPSPLVYMRGAYQRQHLICRCCPK